MSLKTDKLLTTFVEAINKTKDGTKPYDTTAEVTRVEDDTVWVHIPSGVSETPIRKTIACSVGDTVQIRVSGGTAWITGNSTAPPTDDARANVAYNVAVQADENALLATEYANSAEQEAKRAKESADGAVSSARLANEKAQEAKDSADEAKGYAEDAQESAEDAVSYANSALTQLGIVEDVVGTLNWISEHGTYKASTDTEVVEGKYYFTRTGSGTPSNPYVYTVVPNPTGNPSANHYYELDSVDEAVSNYVSSHLALTSQGLWVINDNSAYRILLSNTGMKVYNGSGTEIASFGASITFSANSTQYIGNNNCFVAFNPANGGSLTIGGATINIGNQTLDQVLADKADTDDIPTKTSDLTNDSNFANTTQVDNAKNEAISTASTDATNKANDAKKYATNFLASDSSGIMIYDGENGTQTPASPSSTTRNVFIDSDSVDIRQGTTVLATFGETVQIGEIENPHITMESQSLLGYGATGLEFFNITADGSEMASTSSGSYSYKANSATDTRYIPLNRYGFYTDLSSGETFKVSVKYFDTGSGAISQTYTFTKGTSSTDDPKCSYIVNSPDQLSLTGYTVRTGQTYYSTEVVISVTVVKSTPTYSFGGELDVSGGYAFAEGYDNTVSGDYSHAEGKGTTASGEYSHSEGWKTTASGFATHAEGQSTTASNNHSHAEGCVTKATGAYSHSQNYYTIAKGQSQTAIGKSNIEDTNNVYALIIGNGSSSSARSNALTVDWNGNVDIASGAKYRINGNNLSASDIGAVPTTRTVNSKALSSNITLTASDVGALPNTTFIPSKTSDLTNDSGYITSSIFGDYVVEQGTSGIWTYRKWSSGIAECWGTSNQTNVAATTRWPNASMYYGQLTDVSFPSGLFTSAPTICHLFGRITGGNGWLTQNTNISSSTVGTVYVIAPSSITLTNVNINIYAIGRWK